MVKALSRNIFFLFDGNINLILVFKSNFLVFYLVFRLSGGTVCLMW